MRWASWPPRGRTTGCSCRRPHRLQQNTRGKMKYVLAEQRQVGRATKRATQELTGVVVWTRSSHAGLGLPEAVHRTKRPDRNATAVVDRRIQTKQPAKTTPTGPAQQGLDEPRVKAVEDAGAFQAPTNAARSFNPQHGKQDPRLVLFWKKWFKALR